MCDGMALRLLPSPWPAWRAWHLCSQESDHEHLPDGQDGYIICSVWYNMKMWALPRIENFKDSKLPQSIKTTREGRSERLHRTRVREVGPAGGQISGPLMEWGGVAEGQPREASLGFHVPHLCWAKVTLFPFQAYLGLA